MYTFRKICPLLYGERPEVGQNWGREDQLDGCCSNLPTLGDTDKSSPQSADTWQGKKPSKGLHSTQVQGRRMCLVYVAGSD